MTLHLRPIVAALLCGILALGHAPAWLHVASCDDHALVDRSAETEPVDQSHCCHDHGADQSTEAGDESSDDSSNHHDSDRCATCLSLAAPSGLFQGLEAPLSVEPAHQRLLVIELRAEAAQFQCVPLPQPFL